MINESFSVNIIIILLRLDKVRQCFGLMKYLEDDPKCVKNDSDVPTSPDRGHKMKQLAARRSQILGQQAQFYLELEFWTERHVDSRRDMYACSASTQFLFPLFASP